MAFKCFNYAIAWKTHHSPSHENNNNWCVCVFVSGVEKKVARKPKIWLANERTQFFNHIRPEMLRWELRFRPVFCVLFSPHVMLFARWFEIVIRIILVSRWIFHLRARKLKGIKSGQRCIQSRAKQLDEKERKKRSIDTLFLQHTRFTCRNSCDACKKTNQHKHFVFYLLSLYLFASPNAMFYPSLLQLRSIMSMHGIGAVRFRVSNSIFKLFVDLRA